MTFVTAESGSKLLIDLNIRAAADDPDDDTPDVASKLRDRLSRDDEGRLYVDALLVSHPDKDHCTGLDKHFHLGTPDTWSKVSGPVAVAIVLGFESHPFGMGPVATLTTVGIRGWVGMVTGVSHVLVFVFVIGTNWVRMAADAYARQLLASCDVLESRERP